MAAAFRVLLTIYLAILMIGAWILAFSFQFVVFGITYFFMDYYKRIMILGHIFRGVSAGFVTMAYPFWRVKRITPLPTQPGKTIVMCNHLSNTDPFMLCKALFPWETKYISKSSLFQVPFGGWAMSLSGDIPIYFTKEKGGWGTKKGSIGKMMDHCKDLLAHKIPITVFPEGVRSKTGAMGEFKDGMFMLAKETQADIIPVAIYGSEKAWPVGDWRFNSANVLVAVGDLIQVKPEETHEQLKGRVRSEIERLSALLASEASNSKKA